MKSPPLRRRRWPRRATNARAVDRQASEAWAQRARTNGCVVCGALGAHGHHILTQSLLRREALANGYDYNRVRFDLRNLLPLCPRHHGAHHSYAHRLSLELVERHAPKVRQFARELGLEWALERTYQARSAT